MTEALTPTMHLEVEETSSPTIKSAKKTKTTIYLTEDAENAFSELYITRYRKNKKIDRSTIACEAILALFEKELG